MEDEEEIVMTAAKRNGSAIMRLERINHNEIDFKKVHHVAGGPYKGILINKAATDLNTVEASEGRLEFLAYMVDEDHNNEAIQDYWTLRFWFQGNADGMTKKKTFTDYFQELMNPTNFPKNYIGFIKKALVVLRSYPVIKRVDLEVNQTTEPPPEESLPPIKSFTTVFTPAVYTYQLLPEIPIQNKTFITFMLKAAGDAHIALSAVYSELERKTWEITIGAENNTKSTVKEGAMGQVKIEALTLNILTENDFRYFWISWAENHIEVGRGAQYGYGRFLHWYVPPNKQFNVNCLGVSTDKASRGQWEFAEILDPEEEFGKQARKKKLKKSLIWLAKKQRILQCLEDSYPNTIPIAHLLKLCKVKLADTTTAAVMLNDLQNKGFIKEVEKGFWMRIQSGGADANDEVQIVKNIPRLTSQEQPTIAVITSLYCEKLAVDALIDNKTTFVKYKTEGESQVYSVGRIGRHKIVSTKLSKDASSPENSKISTENSVTRLLGTFSKVQHVFLVGVGGSVPDYEDASKHVRLGDIVVSLPSHERSCLYVHCQKVEHTLRTDEYKFSVKHWACADDTLQKVVEKIKNITDSSPDPERPWDIYLEEASERLKAEESSFHRPFINTDRLYYTNPDGTVVEVQHPSGDRNYNEGRTNVRFGAISNGMNIAKDGKLRKTFARLYGIKAYDLDTDAILESLEGNRNESFLIIRGIADYADGSRKEWQPYSAMAAAAYMKTLIMAL
ncbi:uncharacterized protein LOC127715718 [Mytilus californianus]|uniref:uncharacterized protein LOC127715718 n=1 Tax=Mytilus californianus TaxID=6549 RepID=UPI0022467175|nr:uncharacterized protein LOC127715718 [Mytilus californianus]